MHVVLPSPTCLFLFLQASLMHQGQQAAPSAPSAPNAPPQVGRPRALRTKCWCWCCAQSNGVVGGPFGRVVMLALRSTLSHSTIAEIESCSQDRQAPVALECNKTSVKNIISQSNTHHN